MGKVLWQIPLLKTTRCNMDVRYFPYDIQTCYLDLSSWRMLGSEINLEFMEDYSGEAAEEVAKFRHPEWNLIYVDKIREVQGWEGYEVPILKFKYAFHRQSKYFEYTMVYPTVLICLMAFISFNLPNDCGEKIGFSITILLALVLNLCLIGGYIPHASVNFPIMAEFFFGGICAVSASVVQSVMILLMYHSSEKPKEPSKLMRKVILGWLAKVTFTSLKGLENDHMLEDDNSSEQEKSSTKEENDTKKISASDFADAVLVISNHIKQSQQEISESESENLPSTASELLLNSLYNVQVSARNWVAREQEDRNEHFIKLQWKLIAQVFDRLLMIFFTFICAGCGLAFKLRFYMGEQAALSQFPKKEEEADDYYYYYYDYDYNYENLAVN
ncbi:acetylcholine receptor subunit beta-like 2 [Symsagittifera roscoffensis]|uniref:acetylcholine receptor subunit beta-like 2 n=1 Tax=Symsagittifera roscoffensis TaxID=84072 RepID=UPI00307CB8CD